MTRISDLGMQQLLLSGFQRASDAAQSRQIQLSSGKVSDRYSGIGPQTNQLLSAEGVLTRTTAYEKSANVALSRLQIQESAVSSIGDTIADLRQLFVTTLANGSSELLLPEVETAAQRTLSALNTQSGGVFVFGGTDGTQPPVAAETLGDIGAAVNTDDLFAGGERARLAVEAGTTIDGGPLARDFASRLVAEFGELANAETTLGPFQGQLTAAQRDFLVEKVARFDEIAAELITELGLNGVAQSQAEDAVSRGRQARDLAEIVASEIEDADLAEVVSRLNQDQIAIQAAAQALSQATQLSLLNFI